MFSAQKGKKKEEGNDDKLPIEAKAVSSKLCLPMLSTQKGKKNEKAKAVAGNKNCLPMDSSQKGIVKEEENDDKLGFIISFGVEVKKKQQEGGCFPMFSSAKGKNEEMQSSKWLRGLSKIHLTCITGDEPIADVESDKNRVKADAVTIMDADKVEVLVQTGTSYIENKSSLPPTPMSTALKKLVSLLQATADLLNCFKDEIDAIW